MSKKRLVVIDGKSVFYRGYYAMPNLATKDGRPTGGVYGFAVMALEVLKKFAPDYVAVAWDKPKTNIRRRVKIYPQYKANRKPAPPDFYEQVPILHELLDALSWPLYEIDDHEADDIMGSFAVQADKKDIDTLLVSSDHDLFQLVNSHTKIAKLKKGLTNVEIFDKVHFEEVYGMTPQQFVDFKALRGDPSDNLPGVKGVGEKTAKQLITDYGSLDNVYKNLDKIKPAVKKKLASDKDSAYLTKELVLLDLEVPLQLDFAKADIHNLKPKLLHDKLQELEFRTLLKQLPKEYQYEGGGQEKVSGSGLGAVQELNIIDSQTSLATATAPKTAYVYSYSRGSHGRDLEKLILADDNHSWLLDVKKLNPKAVAEWLNEADGLKLIGYDTKHTIEALLWLGVDELEASHDVKVASFLLNSLVREQNLSALAREELGYEGRSLDEVHPEDVESVGPYIIAALKALYKVQVEKLHKLEKVEKLARDIEWPVIPVLAKMQKRGIELNVEQLKKMSLKLNDMISDVTQQIYGHADQEFNISSPTQLAEVLYDKLSLPTHGVKKGKTGYSTAARELVKLKGLHPIIEHIHDYRELTKLKNTYVDTLPEQVDEDGRLRTTFSLTTAQTGRLSSHDPNLQNIPIRSELGREIRSAFVAGKGRLFISADYSQFELRLAAAMAGDDDLIEAFNSGLDIHTRTAAQVYGCAQEDVTKQQRDHAKVINFGILYGMSPHGLSQATGMSAVEAKEFIDRYFELRLPILEFIENTKELAKTKGYVETLFGRRRPTPDVHSSNYVVREAALRAAVNMPIQGTEADLMKIAMVEVEKHLDKDCLQLLQIHDSILIECPAEKAEKTAKLVKAIMEGVHKLSVNLDVEVRIDDNWGEV